MSEPLLEAVGIEKHYTRRGGWLDRLGGGGTTIRAVDGVSLAIEPGEAVGLVGESGCGKTTLGQTLVRLTDPTSGTIRYRGEDITAVEGARLRALRGELQYVFQDTAASLDPRQPVAAAIGEPLDIHQSLTGEERDARIAHLLEQVGLHQDLTNRYPHELSGGQRQRIGIARSLAVEPTVMVLDEPVTALDVSVQASILELLAELQADLDLAYLFIAHDLAVVRHLCDRVGVMYLGEIVERGPVEAVFEAPSHPYTEALLSAIPVPDPRWDGDRIVLEGTVPDPADPPSGCRFHTRCSRIIAPAEYDLSADEMHAVVALRERLEGAASGEVVAPTASAVRETVGVPTALEDGAADAIVSEACEAAASGSLAAARDALEPLTSPCEQRSPAPEPGTAEHPIACWHYRDESTQNQHSGR